MTEIKVGDIVKYKGKFEIVRCTCSDNHKCFIGIDTGTDENLEKFGNIVDFINPRCIVSRKQLVPFCEEGEYIEAKTEMTGKEFCTFGRLIKLVRLRCPEKEDVVLKYLLSYIPELVFNGMKNFRSRRRSHGKNL